jgi:hypothetical protein
MFWLTVAVLWKEMPTLCLLKNPRNSATWVWKIKALAAIKILIVIATIFRKGVVT